MPADKRPSSKHRDAGNTMPVQIEVSKPSYFLRKSHFGYKNRAHDYEDATFDWVLKRGIKPRPEGSYGTSEIILEPIEVIVHDQEYKPINPQLTLKFEPTKKGLKEAESYARQIIEAGALMANVDIRVSFPYDYGKLLEKRMFNRPL
jgi:hypothetical protein